LPGELAHGLAGCSPRNNQALFHSVGAFPHESI
jgi:hypothetical protein